MNWIVLVVAGMFETMWASALAQPDWWRRPLPLAAFVVGSLISLGGLSWALRSIPVGTGYAVWVGVGATTTVLYGVAVLGEPATVARLVCIGLIMAGIIGLKLVS
ncbi:quaternary ammonium compound-resistance protein SugE [Austwickia chelonae]|uniref:Putative multidrug resistance protein n=1 Tax=Austwickia chelonae NBRC 105200 TaxID=1184607 RepID=K6VJL8_9MICO|nr:multidrug efflux SMR transporter [Austwickia chelonae]GAB76929.1 putative multidrug resistance protein [Austwickia chelonae NBRC 105200]SEW32466.1 quaternary ammonium compound-resistance protein SugE [Austwickia chelonae]